MHGLMYLKFIDCKQINFKTGILNVNSYAKNVVRFLQKVHKVHA